MIPPISVTGGAAAPSQAGSGTGDTSVGGVTIYPKATTNYLLIAGVAVIAALVVFRMAK